jgi:hypothetical protein
MEDSNALAYVAGFILRNMTVCSDCSVCRSDLFAESVSDKHQFVSLKEYDDEQRSLYASDPFLHLVSYVHELLYTFLNQNGHTSILEDSFQTSFDVFNILIAQLTTRMFLPRV